MNKIKAMIVDDSAAVRQALTAVLEGERDIEVIATAPDPFVAAERMRKQVPDVIVLDLEMPRMDGLTFLERLMAQHPLPVVVCSNLASEGSRSALTALELGAVEVITKPQLGGADFILESAERIRDAVRAAGRARVKRRSPPTAAARAARPSLPSALPASRTTSKSADRIIAVGASTGGTEALLTFLRALRPPCPGILVVQHMPEQFTAQFARRLDKQCQVRVKEAEHAETVLQNRALIAPGNKHMELKRSGSRYYVTLHEGPLVSRHRPSVDVLFHSTAVAAGDKASGVIMTGMGDDGAQGLLAMRNAGARTFAQDEASCVVFGMPQAAIQVAAVDEVVGLEQLAAAVLRRG